LFIPAVFNGGEITPWGDFVIYQIWGAFSVSTRAILQFRMHKNSDFIPWFLKNIIKHKMEDW